MLPWVKHPLRRLRAVLLALLSLVVPETKLIVCFGFFQYKPRDFASQINMNLAQSWGILKGVVDLCTKLPEGTPCVSSICAAPHGPIHPPLRLPMHPARAAPTGGTIALRDWS